jgi:hypothetical protein
VNRVLDRVRKKEGREKEEKEKKVRRGRRRRRGKQRCTPTDQNASRKLANEIFLSI